MKRLIFALLFLTTIPVLADDEDAATDDTEQVPSVEDCGNWETFQDKVDPHHDMP